MSTIQAQNSNSLNAQVQEWLEAARWAPSGGNAQPWKVIYSSDASQNVVEFELSIRPDYLPLQSPLDVNGSAAVLSLGAFAFNLIQMAKLDGFNLSMQSYKKGNDFWFSTVQLKLQKTKQDQKTILTQQDETILNSHIQLSHIMDRHTNRNPFKTEPISEEAQQTIKQCVNKYSQLKIVEINPQQKKQFVQDLLPLEAIRWQSKVYLESLMQEISLSETDSHYSTQIPLDQLGIGSSDQLFFRGLKKYNFLRTLLRKFLFPMVLSKSLQAFRKDCDRIYLLQATTNDFANLFVMGQCYQEIWIELNKRGLGFQPWGTPLVALGHWQKEKLLDLTLQQKIDVEKTTEKAQKQYDLNLKLPVMGFRVGIPTKVHGKAPRRKLLVESKNANLNAVRTLTPSA